MTGRRVFNSSPTDTELNELTGGGATTLHSHAGGAGVPAGVICMWSGLLANIPAGWSLCDGLGGRPDLRSLFIKGAAVGVDPGATGGAATHTHAGHSAHVVTQPGNHVITQAAAHGDHASQGAHTHDAHTAGRKGGTTNPQDIFNAPVTHSSAGGHTHDAHSAHSGAAVDGHSGAAVDAHSAHDTPNSEPAYYSLAFIMKD